MLRYAKGEGTTLHQIGTNHATQTGWTDRKLPESEKANSCLSTNKGCKPCCSQGFAPRYGCCAHRQVLGYDRRHQVPAGTGAHYHRALVVHVMTYGRDVRVWGVVRCLVLQSPAGRLREPDAKTTRLANLRMLPSCQVARRPLLHGCICTWAA